jgi:hypothetical protein
MRKLVPFATALTGFLLAAFLGFVGWHKTFSSLTDLAVYGSWTVHLWEPLGRLIGVSEMVCAAALVLPTVWSRAALARRWACLYFIANQIAAATVHAGHGETQALPQNAVLVALCLFILWGTRPAQSAGG